MMEKIKHPLVLVALSFAAGSLAALSMAPFNAWPVLLISLPALYVSTLYARSWKSAALYGWLFGFGYFLFSLSWIGNALLVEGNPYKWAWPLAASGLPALLAFFPAIAVLIIKKFMNLRSVWGWLGFISLYCGFEWLRGHVFTGFPWNLMGYAWADTPMILQILWLSDVYMLTWLTLFWLSVPACVLFAKRSDKLIAGGVVIASFLAALTFGHLQLKNEQTYHDDLNIRIVQPNIAQAEKWQRDKMADHFFKHLELSKNRDQSKIPTLFIWPETALSYRILNDPRSMLEIQKMLADYSTNSALLTGLLRHNPSDGSYTNSLVMIDDQSRDVQNIYDKHHLVPFGEYIPFQEWIPLTPITQFKGFKPGAGLQTLTTPTGMKYSPLICYEIIFPGRSIADNVRPDFIVNVTNDAWYGISAGPHQHLTQAVFRAIETGIPVIRAANTGFSGIISPYGHIGSRTNLFENDSLSMSLPQKRKPFPLFFDKKHLFVVLFLLFFGMIGIRSGKRFANRD